MGLNKITLISNNIRNPSNLQFEVHCSFLCVLGNLFILVQINDQIERYQKENVLFILSNGLRTLYWNLWLHAVKKIQTFRCY